MSAVIADRDRWLSEVIEREHRGLRSFIRKRVVDAADAEEILQDIFYELVEAYRAINSVEQVGACFRFEFPSLAAAGLGLITLLGTEKQTCRCLTRDNIWTRCRQIGTSPSHSRSRSVTVQP